MHVQPKPRSISATCIYRKSTLIQPQRIKAPIRQISHPNSYSVQVSSFSQPKYKFNLKLLESISSTSIVSSPRYRLSLRSFANSFSFHTSVTNQQQYKSPYPESDKSYFPTYRRFSQNQPRSLYSDYIQEEESLTMSVPNVNGVNGFHPPPRVTPMSLMFLGTSAGGGPTASRSCSSLVLDIMGNGELWMVDCAEGTLRQFMHQPEPKSWKVSKITKLFITHLHFDHCMGIIPLLASLLRGGHQAELAPRSTLPQIIIYGPAGVRTFVRSILKMTSTALHARYSVHELLTPSDTITTCNEVEMHDAETPGLDILCDSDGLWRDFTIEDGYKPNGRPSSGPREKIEISAGPISHRVACLGYIFNSPSSQRKVVILGDTSDPSAITPLAMDATLLVHEATDTFIPSDMKRSSIDGSSESRSKKTVNDVEEKMRAKGHSTATMAGNFAKTIGTKMFYMNHISAKFYYPQFRHAKGREVIGEIERQASKAWGMGRAKVAYDFTTVNIPVFEPSPPSGDGYDNYRMNGHDF